MIFLQQIAPDGWFWYALSTTLALAIIGIIWRYSNKIDAAIDRLEQNVTKLTEMQGIHETKLDAHSEDIKLLKSKL